MRDLLCIHGHQKIEDEKCRMQSDLHSSLCTLDSALKLAPEVGIAPTSPPLQGGANLPQLLGETARQAAARRAKSGLSAVARRAKADYQPGALLLSYETVVNCGFTPKRRTGRNTKFSFAAGRTLMTRRGL